VLEGELPKSTSPADQSRGVALLFRAERAIFYLVGSLFLLAAFVLAIRAAFELWQMIVGPADATLLTATRFLDVMLLVLMVVELAYTVLVSLQGAALLPEPFLIVGLIAVIRRMLVITVGEIGSGGTPSGTLSTHALELLVLTGIVIAFVGAIVLLRARPRSKNFPA
jgi:hypothetical protein